MLVIKITNLKIIAILVFLKFLILQSTFVMYFCFGIKELNNFWNEHINNFLNIIIIIINICKPKKNHLQ